MQDNFKSALCGHPMCYQCYEMVFNYRNRPHADIWSCPTCKTVIEGKSDAKETSINNLCKKAEEARKYGTDKEKAIR